MSRQVIQWPNRLATISLVYVVMLKIRLQGLSDLNGDTKGNLEKFITHVERIEAL